MTIVHGILVAVGVVIGAGIMLSMMIRDLKWERDKNKRLQRLNANMGKTIERIRKEEG